MSEETPNTRFEADAANDAALLNAALAIMIEVGKNDGNI